MVIRVLTIVFALSIFFSWENAFSQKLEYTFGEDSDVIDSIKNVINFFKFQDRQKNETKLNLFATVEFCNGNIDLSVSQYLDKDIILRKLIKQTDRFIRIANNFSLPVIFPSDILTKGIATSRTFINTNGYYIEIIKNEKYVWKVNRMQITF